MFLDSTTFYLLGGLILDAVILIDAGMIYLWPSLIDSYSLPQMEEKLEESGPFIFIFKPEWLLPYLVSGSSALFIDSQRAFSYVLEYFKLDIHSYPKSSWFVNPN